MAQQSDFMKRVRGNGGSRTRLLPEGYLLLGDSQAHRLLAVSLGLPEPVKGETVSVRVVRAEEAEEAPTVFLDDVGWRVARQGDPVGPGPLLPNPRASEDPASIEQTFEHSWGAGHE